MNNGIMAQCPTLSIQASIIMSKLLSNFQAVIISFTSAAVLFEATGMSVDDSQMKKLASKVSAFFINYLVTRIKHTQCKKKPLLYMVHFT